jgi:hypothetical protein
MSDWERNFMAWIDELAEQTETVLLDLSQDIESAIEETAQEVKTSFEQEIAPWLNQLLQPILETPLEFNFDFDRAVDDVVNPFRQTVEPTLNQHPVCVGCKHYHGQVYGGQMLVCGMHPYGVAEGQAVCADKEAIDWQEPWKSWFSNGDWRSNNWDL